MIKESQLQAFNDYLARRACDLDQMIIKDAKPLQFGWVGTVVYEPMDQRPNWWKSRESVRRIAEGIAFKPSRMRLEAKQSESMFDHFENVKPDCIGEPCDVDPRLPSYYAR